MESSEPIYRCVPDKLDKGLSTKRVSPSLYSSTDSSISTPFYLLPCCFLIFQLALLCHNQLFKLLIFFTFAHTLIHSRQVFRIVVPPPHHCLAISGLQRRTTRGERHNLAVLSGTVLAP